MRRATRKSTVYYIVLFCLTLIGGISVFAMVWQPAFAEGYISFPYRAGSIIFSLWIFLPVLISVILFIFFTTKSMKAPFERRPFLLSFSFGLAFVILYLLLITNFDYAATSIEDFSGKLSYFSFSFPLFIPLVVIVLAMGFLTYKRRKLPKR